MVCNLEIGVVLVKYRHKRFSILYPIVIICEIAVCFPIRVQNLANVSAEFCNDYA